MASVTGMSPSSNFYRATNQQLTCSQWLVVIRTNASNEIPHPTAFHYDRNYEKGNKIDQAHNIIIYRLTKLPHEHVIGHASFSSTSLTTSITVRLCWRPQSLLNFTDHASLSSTSPTISIAVRLRPPCQSLLDFTDHHVSLCSTSWTMSITASISCCSTSVISVDYFVWMQKLLSYV